MRNGWARQQHMRGGQDKTTTRATDGKDDDDAQGTTDGQTRQQCAIGAQDYDAKM